MIRKIVHNSDTNEEVEQQANAKSNVGKGTTNDNYEYLDNIDFLQHIDMSEYEKEVLSVETDEDKDDEIGVNVDYLGDLAYFDELDYFDQLNKSLEKELKELDTKIRTSSVATKRRWFRKHSNVVMVTAGIGVLLFVGGVVVSAVGIHLSKNDVSYASTKYDLKDDQSGQNNKEVLGTATQSPAPTGKGDVIPFVEVGDKKQQDTAGKNGTVSEQMIPKREEITPATVSPTEAPKATETPTPTGTAIATATTTKEPSSSDLEAFFEDSVFIGNSLPNGLQMAGGPKSAHYLAATSLNVNDVFTRQFVKTSSGMKTAMEALEDIKCSKIYVMFGINEIGWPYPKIYEERYIKVIKKIQEIQPDATIYVQSLLPVSKKLTDTDREYRTSNMRKFNEAMKDAAKKTNSVFVNVWDSVVGRDGYLPADAAVDGMHMKREYNKRWVAYLYENTK
ncbi:MAG: GDSL-type esterase/lipase family protein [bacterium]|nr:GDSL-type esterase/lipase family protein [bacterium]